MPKRKKIEPMSFSTNKNVDLYTEEVPNYHTFDKQTINQLSSCFMKENILFLHDFCRAFMRWIL